MILNRRILIILAVLSVFSGCKVTSLSKNGIPSRAYQYSNTLPIKGFRTYGYILFSRYTPSEVVNRMSYLFLTKLNEYQGSRFVSVDQIMQTYWLLRRPDSAYPHPPTLSRIVLDFDYDRALLMLASIHKTDARGPILVAWTKPYETLHPEEIQDCLIVDLSRYTTEDLERQMRLWQDYLAMDIEKTFNFSFMVSRFSEETRQLFSKYGDVITNQLKELK